MVGEGMQMDYISSYNHTYNIDKKITFNYDSIYIICEISKI